MAEFRLTNEAVFPEATKVGAYPALNWPTPNLPNGAPLGAPAATATMANGAAVFTGLGISRYFAVAQVNGVWRYIAFETALNDIGFAYLLAPRKATDPLKNLGSLPGIPDAKLINGAALSTPGMLEGAAQADLDGINDYIDAGWECKVSTAALVQQLGSETFVYTLRQLDNGDILAGTQPQGAVYRSKDNGATWALVKENVAGASIIHEIIDLGKGVVLAATDNKGKVARSTDYGATWNEGTALGEEERVNCFTDLGGGVVLAGTRTALKGGKVFRSTDNGVTWGAGQALGGVNQGVNWMSGLGKNVVILGGFDDLKVNWFRSTDNGATWARIESEVLNATNGEYGHTGANIGEGVALIATYDSSGAGAPHIYRTIDYGVTWKSVHTGSGIQGFFCIEHVGNGRLLAGSGINPATCRIYISEDDGLTWSIFQQGLGKTATHVLAMAHIPAADRVLIAAGTTGEVWSAEVALPFVNGAARTFVGVALRDTSTSWDVLLGSNGTEADEAHGVVSLSIAENSNDVHFHANTFITASTWTDAWPGTDVAVFWALVFDEPNNTVELFINGVSKGSQAITAQFSTTPGALTLGIRKNTIFALDGALLPFGVALGKLNTSEIAALATRKRWRSEIYA